MKELITIYFPMNQTCAYAEDCKCTEDVCEGKEFTTPEYCQTYVPKSMYDKGEC